MQTFISKITSRKLWAAIIGFVSPLLIILGVSTTQAEKITLIIMAGAVLIGYIFGQGLVDAATASAPTLVSDASVSADALAVATDGTLQIDTSNPIKDTYNLALTTPLNTLAGQKTITLTIDSTAKLATAPETSQN